jgi:hypothetical protein
MILASLALLPLAYAEMQAPPRQRTTRGSVAQQQAAGLPQNATVAFAGAPTTLDRGVPVRMTSHSVTHRLRDGEIVTETVSLFRNQSNRPVTARLALPVYRRTVNAATTPPVRIQSAVWDRNPLSLNVGGGPVGTSIAGDARDGAWTFSTTNHVANVTFRPQGTHSLRVVYQSTPGRAGLDRLLRVVAYDISPATAWAGPIGQFNYSIQYNPQIVFQVFSYRPTGWDWRVDLQSGAFVRRDNFVPPQDGLLAFVYYPNTFEPIGGE